MLAMTRHFVGMHCFITISQDDTNSPNAFCLSFQSCNNDTFPAIVSRNGSFLDAMTNNSTILRERGIEIPCGYRVQLDSATNPPIATTLEYIRMIDVVISVLFGIDEDHHSKKSVYYKDHRK